jgi:TorA maturation chaperone TorD
MMRSSLYLLAAVLFDEPRAELRDARRSLIARVAYRSPNQARWVAPLLEISDARLNEEQLRIEYARLFVLAQPRVVAQPYGSCWLEPDRQLMGNTTIEVRNMMREHGLAPDAHSGLLPDHIVCELEFMAWLAEQEDTQDTQEVLLQRHLGIWVPRFLDALDTCEPPRFYRMAARYLREVLAWDRIQLNTSRRSPVAA